MKIYKYKNDDEYIEAQKAANKRKIKKIWVHKSTIMEIKKRQPQASFILCHGTRNAAEQSFFQEAYPEAQIVGTEISDTALDFPLTVQWDFRKEKKDWIGQFDIVYSNSFDHTNQPQETLKVWKNQLKKKGILVIEYSFAKTDNKSRKSDPLEITSKEFRSLCRKEGLLLIDEFVSIAGKHKKECQVSVYRLKER